MNKNERNAVNTGNGKGEKGKREKGKRHRNETIKIRGSNRKVFKKKKRVRRDYDGNRARISVECRWFTGAKFEAIRTIP